MRSLLLVLCVVGLAFAQFSYEYNTGGTLGMLPTLAGSSTGWAEYFVVTLQNTTVYPLRIMELRFPCCGPQTSAYGWVVWTGLSGLVPPAGDPTTAQYYGQFTPAIPSGGSASDITEYTVVDLSLEEMIIIAPGEYWCFGYDNTQLGGQTTFNGVVTYGWYEGSWDSDQPWGRTGLLEFAAYYWMSLDQATWAQIKASF
ncbi:MAG TPA: hypothetical protein PLF04_05510 [Candidatus Fermentibacter daniensis]|nr:hypothetical protein [Candidatus Fermentibacter daniensis]HOZ17774.1 hypothetical protein [Candidatus Fermentibacter daniensis]HPH39445.1 hypothetical protein [Candidatus Fermentibacter daniensis]HPH39446.1 hypothetical protein [Candidatus Fermentibacter daniensis]HPN62147.1 hypothetical protein [Candidatus Fermentibacter daniensis]